MDLNVNELPETNDSRLKPEHVEMDKAMQPAKRDGSSLIKAAAFLVVVFVLTAFAINSHTSGPATMASDTPPAVAGATTMPAVTAPTDRATTGAAPAMPPTMAPSAPGEPNATGAQPNN